MFRHPEDGRAAHAIERLEHDLALLAQELAQAAGFAGNQGRRATVGEPGRKKLLIGIAQRAGFVDHPHTMTLGAFQQIGGVDVLLIEGRVFAHQDHVQCIQRCIQLTIKTEP